MNRLNRLTLLPFSCLSLVILVGGYDCGVHESFDEMALNYATDHANTVICIQLPKARVSEEQVKSEINNCGRLIYQKEVILTQQGIENFLSLLTEDLLQEKEYVSFIKKGFDEGVSECCLQAFLFEVNVQLMKNVGLLLHTLSPLLFVSQSHGQMVSLAQTFFNTNSIHRLNYAQKVTCTWFDVCIKKFGAWIEHNNYSRACFCVDSDTVLAAYGLRDCSEISFLYHGNEPLKASLDGFFCNNEHAVWYPECLDDILFNPSYHFWYKGIKFASLNVVRTMKMAHDGLGNWSDVALIDSLYHD